MKKQKPNKEGSWRIIETTFYGRDGERTEENSYKRKGMYDNERSFQTQLKSKKTQAKNWDNVRLDRLGGLRGGLGFRLQGLRALGQRLTVQTFDGSQWVTLEIWESWKYRAEDSEA